MKICVLIKQVPDKDSQITISDNNLSIQDDNITWVSNESDTYALEEALQLKETHGGEVTVCTMGNESARQVLKDSLAKGADRGIFISNNGLNQSDILIDAKIFASIFKNEAFDLILSGLQSDDQGNSQLGVLLSELLEMSHASLVMGTELIDSKHLKVKKELENGWFQWSTLSIPASISIQSGINTPRYATLKGIMMVKNKTVDEHDINTLTEIDTNSKVSIDRIYIPEKSKETLYIDGTSDEISDKLIEILKNDIKVMG